VRKGQPGIAVGNVLGSNIANIFLVLGLSTSLTPVAFDGAPSVDLGLVIACSAPLPVFMLLRPGPHGLLSFGSRARQTERGKSLAFLAAGFACCVFLFVRA